MLIASSTNTVEADIRIIHDDGSESSQPFVEAHPDGGRTASRFTGDRIAKPGWVVGAYAAIVGTGIKRGQIYAIMEIVGRDGRGKTILGRDYTYETHAVNLGDNVPPGPEGGVGFIRSITGTNPAAGTEVSEAVPTNALWKLKILIVTIVGGVAAFNPQFSIGDGTTEKWRSEVITVAGGATEIMVLAEHGTRLEAGTSLFTLPDDLLLPEAYTVDTVGITADDDYAAPELWVEEWIVV